MRYRSLGATGLTVSEIGFGAWGIGGPSPGATSYGPTDDALSLRALARALECGVTFFDTANAYGDGHSEALIGRALEGRRDAVVVATKAGFPSFGQAPDFSPEALRRSLEGSLRRLQTDHVDLFQLHSPPIDMLRDDAAILDAVRALIREGKARTYGVSVRTPEDGLVAVRDLAVPVIQVNLNLLDQRAVDSGLIALAEQRGAALIARTPLCFGMLSGTLADDARFDARDHRSRWSRAQIRRWLEGSRAFVAALEADGHGTPAQVALRYCLSHRAVASAIPGMLRPEEVDDNVGASDRGPLPAPALAEIARIYASTEFFVSDP
ncbi:MAG TPA: aldo/keto reductase [Candidatus Sulfotelmatobacter sp.]|nr:aldo/keto reductase [Candidatus Sulfotelmatobacter sp.]